jgi:spore maturation protein CgeB
MIDQMEPDFLVLTRHAIKLGTASIREIVRGRRAAFWYFDPKPRADILVLARIVGSMYSTYLGQLDEYRAAGIPEVRFLPQALDPKMDAPAAHAPERYHCDTSFVGSGQFRYRDEVLRAVAAVSRLQIRGPGWKGAPADLPVVGGTVRGRRFAKVIKGAAISLGASAHLEQDADRASASNRMWKILGCGGFYLGRHVDGIEHFAADGRHCVWYRTTNEAAELVRHYLGDASLRAEIAAAGRQHALAHHTYAHRVALLLAGKEYDIPHAAHDHSTL